MESGKPSKSLARWVGHVSGSVKGVGGVIEAMFKKYAMKKGERLRVPWQLRYLRICMKTEGGLPKSIISNGHDPSNISNQE